jgi:uncharacterized protein YdeI (YjbR/CyaY-like superfamily)
MTKAELPILHFPTANDLDKWLEEHHTDPTGFWLKIAKKNKGVTSVTYAEAVQLALAYGWIDGQANLFDDQFYLVKYTPRRPRSIWSKRNVDFVANLIKEGKMKPSGLAQVEAAKADGRWAQAYDSPKDMTVPEDFLKELAKDPKAMAFFASLNKSNTYAIAFRLRTAKKPETRERRMQKFLEMMKKGQKLY